MEQITVKKLFEFYNDTLNKCGTFLLNEDDKTIEYNIYEEFDIGKNCNGSKIFWGSQGLDCTVEPGCGFLLHHDDGSCKEVPSPPERIYLDMEGNRIHYGDIEGSAIELTMWDQRVIHMARNYKDN